MKKISLICSALLLGTIPFISCTDMLDEEPLDEFVNNAEFWGNEATVEGYANTFYNQFVGYGTSGNGDFYFPSLTDDQVSYTFTNWTYINVPASISDWKNGYAEIRRSNVMIDGLEKYGESMDSTLKDGDIMLLNEIEYRLGEIERFDIVVIRRGDEYLIKRVIALPGEKVKYLDNKLYINGKYVKENFKHKKTNDFPTYQLGKDEYFVMGDNRTNSKDSRMIGSISRDEILGKASLTIFPFSRFGVKK